jgi:hypothetical protein
MKFAMPCYEVKFRGEKHWEDISEIDLTLKLYDAYDQVIHVINCIQKGQQVQTIEAVYRLKK